MPVASTPTTRRTPLLGCRRDADDRDQLLRREPGHRGSALDRVPRDDPDFRPQRALPRRDVAGDVLRQALDEERLADHDLLDRLLEQLGEARHVHALLIGIEVDGAVDLGRDQLLRLAIAKADRLVHAFDADARQREPDVGRARLDVFGDEVARSRH
jgi:hypothetical protein